MKMKISDSQLDKAIHDALQDMDADGYARIAGEILGGECWVIDYSGMNGGELQYEFTPNENYGGAFGDEDKDTEVKHE